jgi:hypothetical protein
VFAQEVDRGGTEGMLLKRSAKRLIRKITVGFSFFFNKKRFEFKLRFGKNENPAVNLNVDGGGTEKMKMVYW